MNDIQKWGQQNIFWVGNKHTNKSHRRNYIPEIIVSHISQGTAQSCISWFTSPGNEESSAHFLVARDGRVFQFVHIEDNAWANGLNSLGIKESKSIAVKNRGVNPNWYSVSIEHEGVYEQARGQLTHAQLQSTIMLHKYIIDFVDENLHYKIKADKDHILGHNIIDPKNKPNCPGEKFPFDKIIKELNQKEEPEYINILKSKTDNPDLWIKFIEENKDHKFLKWLPELIVKIAK
jgi:N-acetyl-anhydromuramyl-L-alanine amidase AmpD